VTITASHRGRGVGKMADRWRDTALLEKRSETVGL
jgi:L-amino acid N-acyltransferase YncA